MTQTIKEKLRKAWSKARLERKARKLAETRKEEQGPMKSWRNVVTPVRPMSDGGNTETPKTASIADRPGWARKRDRRREEGRR